MVFDSTITAKQIVANNNFQTVSGSLSVFDRSDFYQFTLSSASNFYANTNGLTADAALSILDASGQTLQVSNRSGTAAESIGLGLNAGTYYLQISSVSSNTLYDLQFSTNTLFANIGDTVKFLAGDFNGDSLQDVIRQESGSLVNGVADAQFFLGRSDGSYGTGVDITNMVAFTGNASNLVIGDFNGDGRDDLLRQEFGSLVNGNSDTQISTFNGTNFQLVGNIQGMTSFNGNLTNIIAGDFNQDGRTDLIRQEKGKWVDNKRDVEVYLSTGGWSFSTIVANNASLMTGNQVRLVSSGRDVMRLEHGSLIDGQNDVNFTSFVNGNFQGFVLNPPSGFTEPIVPKPWEIPISQVYVSTLGKLVSNQATLVSPYGTTGRYSFYDSGATIHWSAKTGAKVITKEMEAIYRQQGGTGGWLGLATSHQYSWNGGMRQDFEGGYMFRDANQATAFRPGQSPIFAPQQLQIQGLQASYQANATLSLHTGYVFDSNGWADVKSVDFWLTNAQNQRIELTDVISFTSHDTNRARFSYSTNLGNLAAGTYTLHGVAYDKAGLISNLIGQSFSILQTQDWFDLNLKDGNVANLARNAATDRDLSRNEMLGIFRDIQDGGIIDAIEWGDINTLVKNATGSLFAMKDHVRYLSNKVVAETTTNMAASTFDYGVMGKWFLGTIGPKAEFFDYGNNLRHVVQYQRTTGSLFGSSNQARISGIDQGYYLGDCVLLAAIGATFGRQASELGNTSQVINQMLIDNGDQTYTVQFFNENKELQAEWVTVDNQLAYTNSSLLGSQMTGGLFMPILEKAYAQWQEWTVNNGESGWTLIGNGDTIDVGIQRIVGRTAQVYWTPSSGYNSYTFELIQKALSEGKAVTSGSAMNSLYLVGNHAYSVTQAYISATGQQRVVVYNPWGIDGGQRLQGTNDGFVDLSFDEFQAFQNTALA
jgi:hypothetical protein